MLTSSVFQRLRDNLRTSISALAFSTAGAANPTNTVVPAAPQTAAARPLQWDATSAQNVTISNYGLTAKVTTLGTDARVKANADIRAAGVNNYHEITPVGGANDFGSMSTNAGCVFGLVPADYPTNTYTSASLAPLTEFYGTPGFAIQGGHQKLLQSGNFNNCSGFAPGQTCAMTYSTSGPTISFLGNGDAAIGSGGSGVTPTTACYPAAMFTAADATAATSFTLAQYPDDWTLPLPPGLNPVPVAGPNDDRTGAHLTYYQLASRRWVYQRQVSTGGALGLGYGTVPVSVSIASACTPKYRLRSEADGTIVQSGTLPAQSTTGATTLFLSVDARPGWFFVDIQDDGTTWLLGQRPISMGAQILFVGQSYYTRFFAPSGDQSTITQNGQTVGPNGSEYMSVTDNYTYNTYDHPSSQKPSLHGTYQGSGPVDFLNRQIAMRGVNCMLVGHVEGSQTIANFTTAGVHAHDTLQARLSETAGFEAMYYWMGGSDARNGTTYAAYKSGLDTLKSQITAANLVRGSNFEMYLTSITNWDDGSSTADESNVIRTATADWCATNGAVHVQPNDIALFTDGVHPTQPGCISYSWHACRATKKALTGTGPGDIGPQITGGSRSGATITLNTNLASGAAFVATGNWWTRFSIYPHGTTANLVTPTSGSISGSTITLTLGSAPSGAVDVWAFRAFDGDPANDGGANILRDNVVDGDGIPVGRQLQWTPAAVSVG